MARFIRVILLHRISNSASPLDMEHTNRKASGWRVFTDTLLPMYVNMKQIKAVMHVNRDAAERLFYDHDDKRNVLKSEMLETMPREAKRAFHARSCVCVRDPKSCSIDACTCRMPDAWFPVCVLRTQEFDYVVYPTQSERAKLQLDTTLGATMHSILQELRYNPDAGSRVQSLRRHFDEANSAHAQK